MPYKIYIKQNLNSQENAVKRRCYVYCMKLINKSITEQICKSVLNRLVVLRTNHIKLRKERTLLRRLFPTFCKIATSLY